jgi:hypothetical protein
LITGGNGIAVSGNSISVVGVSDLASSEGVLVRVDTNTNDVSAFVVSDVTNLDGSPDNIQMLSVSRQHGQLPSVVNGSYVLGNGNDQASNGVKVAIGTGFAGGSRLPCGALLVEDGIQTTNLIDTSITNQNGMGSQVARFARLFGPVAGNPGAVGITGNGNIDSTVRYYDVGLSIDTTSVTGGGRFGYLPALSTITGSGSVVEVDGAYAFPGSFVGAFLNKDQFGGGIRVKACDISNKEFALFLENGTAQIGFDGRQNVWPAAAGDVPNHLYKDWQASDAPVFTVRATSGDTFIRGMLVMPFLPGIQAQASAPSPPGADYFSVITDGTTGVVTLHKLVWNGSAYNSASSYTLPKGTIYADNNGNIKIAKGGSHITNHGLNGVGNWRTCDLA